MKRKQRFDQYEEATNNQTTVSLLGWCTLHYLDSVSNVTLALKSSVILMVSNHVRGEFMCGTLLTIIVASGKLGKDDSNVHIARFNSTKVELNAVKNHH